MECFLAGYSVSFKEVGAVEWKNSQEYEGKEGVYLRRHRNKYIVEIEGREYLIENRKAFKFVRRPEQYQYPEEIPI